MSWSGKTRIVIVLLAVVLTSACADRNARIVYEAERALYRADKLKSGVSGTIVPGSSEFLDRAIAAYSEISARFRDYTADDEEIEIIVLTAQLNVARLELEKGQLARARTDFLAILDVVHNVPDARMDALFSAASISQEIGEPRRAFELFAKFYGEYLSLDRARAVAEKKTDYLDTPLRLAALCREIDRNFEEALWLETAETLYESLLESEPDPAFVRIVRFKLLATLVERARWHDALSLSGEMLEQYPDGKSQARLMLQQARIQQFGMRDVRPAAREYQHVYQMYPHAPEAPVALLEHAALRQRLGNLKGASRLYDRVLNEYRYDRNSASQADLQLAIIDEKNGQWMDASLRLKGISRRYPGTQAAFDAPLRLAAGFERLGAPDAARGAYEHALDDYEKIARGHYPVLARLTAEEYILQVYSKLERWEDAIKHLLDVADRYPTFERMQFNYITAAEIYKEELSDERRSEETLITCIARFPNTAAAKEARDRLGPLSADP